MKRQTDKTPKPVKLPPGILSNSDDYILVKEKLNTSNFEYKTSMMSNKQIKVNGSSHEYRKFTNIVNNSSIEWHSYENKATRPMKVMVRNLHRTTTTEEISNELEENNFKVEALIQKLKRTVSNKKIKYIRLLLYMYIDIS